MRINVASRVDDDRLASAIARQQIGSLRQAGIKVPLDIG